MSDEMVEVSLGRPRASEERNVNIVATVRVGSKMVPYIEDSNADEMLELYHQHRQLSISPKRKIPKRAQLRFYKVGPSTCQIRCPMCKHRADTELLEIAGCCQKVNCFLSLLSCCFPIFAVSFALCCIQSQTNTERLFCNRCGGHLGFYVRPT